MDPDRAERDIARLVAQWAAADRVVGGLPLDHVFVSPRWGRMSLRWAHCHLGSEYSRHDGHADMLRQRIDGSTGM